MKLKVYIDTSVIGGCEDIEFSHWSKMLVEEFRLGIKIPVISNLTREELSLAPEKVQKVLKRIDDFEIINIESNDESSRLAEEYIRSKVVRKQDFLDAQHIALATINKVDVLVSWNFKHIVNLDRIHGYNSVNLKYGYSILEIRSPREVLDEKRI